MPKAAPTRAKAVKSRSSKEEKAPLKIKERKDDQWKASDLLQHAKSLFDRFEFEAAAAFSERAIQTRHATLENTATAYSILTACLLEMGDLEKARERFLEMLKIDGLDVDVRIETLFGLAQLSAGEEALRYYVEGISVGMGNHFVSPDIIASAYASIAELYMTDLCDLAAAEAECEQAIQRALESSNGESLDAHRVAADLRLVQGRSEDAKKHAERLHGLLTTSSTPHGLSYDTRITISKLFIELGMHSPAISVLEGLLQEEDEVSDVWYLLALASQQAEMTSDAVEAAESGLGLLERMREAGMEVDAEIEAELRKIAQHADLEEPRGGIEEDVCAEVDEEWMCDMSDS